jgi:environmental stress-induced protein Ves
VPWTFDGERALSAHLTGGPCSDFNVMARRGRWRADVRVLHGAAAVASGHVTLLLAVEGAWQVGQETIEPMQALLWHGLEAPITVGPRSPGASQALIHVRLCHDPFR